MRVLPLNLANASYPIMITDSFENLGYCIKKEYKKCVILTDRNLELLYLDEIRTKCEAVFRSIVLRCRSW